jgi:hypothetical protein
VTLLENFVAAIDSFERAVRDCPEQLWDASLWEVKTTDPWVWPKPGVEPIPERTVESIQIYSAFWQVAAHCAFFLDFYLSGPHIADYRPPSPFEGQMDERWEADGCVELPPRRFTRDELLAYITFGREKAERILPTLAPDDLALPMPVGHPWAGSTYEALLQVNLQHVKEHAGSMVRLIESER